MAVVGIICFGPSSSSPSSSWIDGGSAGQEVAVEAEEEEIQWVPKLKFIQSIWYVVRRQVVVVVGGNPLRLLLPLPSRLVVDADATTSAVVGFLLWLSSSQSSSYAIMAFYMLQLLVSL